MTTTIQTRVLDARIKEYLPKYETTGSAAIDLRACIDSELTIEPGEVKLIPTGVSIYIADPSVAGLILPRSGLGHKNGIVLGNLTGLIDSDYQGPLMISCWNRGTVAFKIQPLDRIAQMMFVPVVHVALDVVDEFVNTSERGAGGFGSTGN